MNLVKLDIKFGQSNILQMQQIPSEFYRYKGYCIYTNHCLFHIENKKCAQIMKFPIEMPSPYLI